MAILQKITRNRLEQSKDSSISGSSNNTLTDNKVDIKKDSNVPNSVGGTFELKKIVLLMLFCVLPEFGFAAYTTLNGVVLYNCIPSIDVESVTYCKSRQLIKMNSHSDDLN